MAFDSLTLAAVVAELRPRCLGGQIQRLQFPDPYSVAFTVYSPATGRSHVLLSAHPERSRIVLLPALPARGLERELPFHLLARKHLRDARLRSLHQPPFERVLEIGIEQRDDDGQRYTLQVIVEVMGRRGNLLLVDADGSIMDALRRTPPSRNPRRPVLPHLRYEPAPPQERLFPHQLSPATLADLARGRGGTLDKFVVEHVAGLSPLAAREVVFRATGATTAAVHGAPWQQLERVIRELVEPMRTGAWEPTVAHLPDATAEFAPHRLEHLAARGAEPRRFASMSEAILAAEEHAPDAPTGDPLRAERQQLVDRLDEARRSHERRLNALRREVEAAAGREEQRQRGELLLAYQTDVPAGAAEVVLHGQPIALDPALNPVENAQRYFERYRKARDAAAQLPAMQEHAAQTLEHLEQLRALALVADAPDAIRALRREVTSALGGKGESRRQPKKGTRTPPRPSGATRRLDLGDGWTAVVGTSAEGNATATFDVAGPDDLWLHARGVPGSHVILQGRGEPPDSIVEQAASAAAWYSSARANGSVEVDVAPRRHVRKIPGGPPGLVRYSHERTIRVPPRQPK